MKKFLIGTMAVAALASCSQDELVQSNDKEISYSVAANKGSRAEDIFCNNNLPASFRVWAKTADGTNYILGDEIKKTADGWVDQVATRYWPAAALDFFAEVNAGDAFNWNGGSPTIDNFTVPTDVTAQKDLLYSVVAGATKGTNNTVAFNFRHALSQVVFKAVNKNAKLHIIIDGVTVGNLTATNTFTYPTVTTDDNYINHDGTNTDALPMQGTWAAIAAPGNTDYAVSFAPVTLTSTVQDLTTSTADGVAGASTAMMLLPQTTTAWDVTPGNYLPAGDAAQTGTYFLVKCKIYNIAGDVYTEGDVQLYDGYAAIPVAIDWKQGYKYTYTFIFDKGNGGLEPDPTDPTPVLDIMKFTVSVDDFADGGNTDIDMNQE